MAEGYAADCFFTKTRLLRTGKTLYGRDVRDEGVAVFLRGHFKFVQKSTIKDRIILNADHAADTRKGKIGKSDQIARLDHAVFGQVFMRRKTVRLAEKIDDLIFGKVDSIFDIRNGDGFGIMRNEEGMDFLRGSVCVLAFVQLGEQGIQQGFVFERGGREAESADSVDERIDAGGVVISSDRQSSVCTVCRARKADVKIIGRIARDGTVLKVVRPLDVIFARPHFAFYAVFGKAENSFSQYDKNRAIFNHSRDMTFAWQKLSDTCCQKVGQHVKV